MDTNDTQHSGERLAAPAGSAYWVGVVKGRWDGHDVFVAPENGEGLTPEAYPNYDCVFGPYSDKAEAEERARTQWNQTFAIMGPGGRPNEQAEARGTKTV